MNKSELIDTLSKLTEMDDVAGIRKLIRRNPEMNNMNCRELNEDFIIHNHRFVKRNGKITLIKDETRYPNATNAVFVGSYQTRKNLDDKSISSIDSNLSIQTELNDTLSGSHEMNDDSYSVNSVQTDLNEMDEDIKSISSINLNQSYLTNIDDLERINSLEEQINQLKEQIEYIKANMNGMGRNLLNFINAYNEDLEPRTEELEKITDYMKKLLSNYI